jgi:hypothetical protein
MDHKASGQEGHTAEEQSSEASPPRAKEPWQEPKLTFIEPKLTTHGKLEEVTGAFFGGFTPSSQ